MNSVIIEDHLDNLKNKEYEGYEAFVYCYEGTVSMRYNDDSYELHGHDCALILNSSYVRSIETAAGTACAVLYIEETFLRQSEPRNPYIIQGTLALYADPVMRLDDKEAHLCRALIENFRIRLAATGHTFYDDILRTSVCMFLLDIYDFHAQKNDGNNSQTSAAGIMARFIALLENKEYRENREVAYYAEKLCVVPKYLSEVSNKISGFSASYWINRYASQDINELLRCDNMSARDVAKMFHFTSTSYFNRYVKRNLGLYPSELKGQ